MHCHIKRLMSTTSVVWLKVYICSINLTIYRQIVLYFTFHLVLLIVIYFAGSYSYATCAKNVCLIDRIRAQRVIRIYI